MVTIEKVEPQELQIIVTGTVNGKEVRAMGSKWPYVNAKSPAHAQRYAQQLLVNASGRPLSETWDQGGQMVYPMSIPDKEGNLQIAPESASLWNKLEEHEKRIAALEALTIWSRIKKYFGLR